MKINTNYTHTHALFKVCFLIKTLTYLPNKNFLFSKNTDNLFERECGDLKK